jgi:hypothetical protein
MRDVIATGYGRSFSVRQLEDNWQFYKEITITNAARSQFDYDRFEKLPEENPTIGILLAADKNDTVVKISLPKDNQTILASQYKLYLPSEEVLREQLVKEMKAIEGRGDEND